MFQEHVGFETKAFDIFKIYVHMCECRTLDLCSKLLQETAYS